MESGPQLNVEPKHRAWARYSMAAMIAGAVYAVGGMLVFADKEWWGESTYFVLPILFGGGLVLGAWSLVLRRREGVSMSQPLTAGLLIGGWVAALALFMIVRANVLWVEDWTDAGGEGSDLDVFTGGLVGLAGLVALGYRWFKDRKVSSRFLWGFWVLLVQVAIELYVGGGQRDWWPLGSGFLTFVTIVAMLWGIGIGFGWAWRAPVRSPPRWIMVGLLIAWQPMYLNNAFIVLLFASLW